MPFERFYKIFKNLKNRVKSTIFFVFLYKFFRKKLGISLGTCAVSAIFIKFHKIVKIEVFKRVFPNFAKMSKFFENFFEIFRKFVFQNRQNCRLSKRASSGTKSSIFRGGPGNLYKMWLLHRSTTAINFTPNFAKFLPTRKMASNSTKSLFFFSRGIFD